jgi:hypothetical protein
VNLGEDTFLNGVGNIVKRLNTQDCSEGALRKASILNVSEVCLYQAQLRGPGSQSFDSQFQHGLGGINANHPYSRDLFEDNLLYDT